jgi:glycosyltransferase involved in cell wall biosynthesis
MLDFFAAARAADPSVFVLVLTQRDVQLITSRLIDKGFSEGDFYVASVGPSDLPRYLNTADVAISFIKACYSKLSSSPTKIAEYLACGLPIIVNPGVGDIDDLIMHNGVGVILDDFSTASYVNALEEVRLAGDIKSRCRQVASTQFDLKTVGGERYRRLYREILD